MQLKAAHDLYVARLSEPADESSISTALACLAGTCTTTLRVVVSPTYSRGESRDAVFNWVFVSGDGASAIRSGQFADGSHWVAPAAGDISGGVKLISLNGSSNPGQTDYLRMDDDPLPHAHGLTDGSNGYGSHAADEDEIPKLPKVYTATDAISLVAAMQRNEAETSNGGTAAIIGEVVDAYCVVTVLAMPPADGVGGANSLRPNIVGDNKELLTWSDFDLSLLPEHEFLTQSWPGDAEFAERMRLKAARWSASTEVFSMSTWDPITLDHEVYSEAGRAFRAHLVHHDYGSGRAAKINSDMLTILGRGSVEDKKPLLAALIAQGLDCWHLVYGRKDFPGEWKAGAGQFNGQYMPSVFATALLVNHTKADRLRAVAADNLGPIKHLRGPSEMRQIMRGQTGVLLWGDDHDPTHAVPAYDEYSRVTMRYWTELLDGNCYTGAGGSCNPNIGKKTTADVHGYIDGPPSKPGTSYLPVTLGTQRSFAAIMILFPAARAVVNSDDVIEYVDRLDRHGLWTSPDPVATVDTRDNSSSCDTWGADAGDGCTAFRTSWGPTREDARFAVLGESGRFNSLDGDDVTPFYVSFEAESHWDEIMAMYDGAKYEDNLVTNTSERVVAPTLVVVPNEDSKSVVVWCATIDAAVECRQVPHASHEATISWETCNQSAPYTLSDEATFQARCVFELTEEDQRIVSKVRTVTTPSIEMPAEVTFIDNLLADPSFESSGRSQSLMITAPIASSWTQFGSASASLMTTRIPTDVRSGQSAFKVRNIGIGGGGAMQKIHFVELEGGWPTEIRVRGCSKPITLTGECSTIGCDGYSIKVEATLTDGGSITRIERFDATVADYHCRDAYVSSPVGIKDILLRLGLDVGNNTGVAVFDDFDVTVVAPTCWGPFSYCSGVRKYWTRVDTVRT